MEMAVLDVVKPFLSAQVMQQVAVPDTDGSFDSLASQKAKPLRPDEFAVCNQALPAFRWQNVQELQDQPHSVVGVAVPRLIERNPDQRKGEAVNHSAQYQKVNRGFAVLPVRAIQAQQHFPRRQMSDEQGHEKAYIQLVIPERAVCASFLGLRCADSRQVGTEVVMIDAPRGNHRQQHVNQALEGVSPKVACMRFEVLGQCGSLLGSGFC